MQENTKVFLTLVVILLAQGVQSSEYNNGNCPICYDPSLNAPLECMTEGITSEAIAAKTKPCTGEKVYCVKWTFTEDDPMPDSLPNKLIHEGDNAKYWCSNGGDATTFTNKFKAGKLRVNIEGSTPSPSPTSGATTKVATTKPATTTNNFTLADATTQGSSSDQTEEKKATPAPIVSCEVGRELVGESCVDCEVNFYKGEDDEECVQCPDGTVTKGVASTSIDDCIQACKRGYYLKRDKCKLCGVNTYSDQPHNTACTSCPDGTNNEASEIRDSVSTCEEVECGPGNYFDAAGRFCQTCPKNTYRDEEDHQFEECEPCPDGTTNEAGDLECVLIVSNNTDGTTEVNPNGGSMGVFLSSILICFAPILVF